MRRRQYTSDLATHIDRVIQECVPWRRTPYRQTAPRSTVQSTHDRLYSRYSNHEKGTIFHHAEHRTRTTAIRQRQGPIAAGITETARLWRASLYVGHRGPVGSGKTALLLALAARCAKSLSVGVVTNDIFTKEDAEFSWRHDALPSSVSAPWRPAMSHTAIRDDISPNLVALDALMQSLHPELLFVESGGDNLAAQFSRDLADYTIYVIDVSGGDKILEKADRHYTVRPCSSSTRQTSRRLLERILGVMDRDARRMRATTVLFTQVKNGQGSRRSCRT